jgi:hypothetical protein
MHTRRAGHVVARPLNCGVSRLTRRFYILLALWSWSQLCWAGDSICYGTVSKGRIENGVALPSSGPNFEAYSTLGVLAGRTYVHSDVAEIIAAAYSALEKATPKQQYVYGGLAGGLAGKYALIARTRTGHPWTSWFPLSMMRAIRESFRAAR